MTLATTVRPFIFITTLSFRRSVFYRLKCTCPTTQTPIMAAKEKKRRTDRSSICVSGRWHVNLARMNLQRRLIGRRARLVDRSAWCEVRKS
jgi:hypothetical protein